MLQRVCGVLDVHLNKVTIDLEQLRSGFGHFFKQQAKLFSPSIL